MFLRLPAHENDIDDNVYSNPQKRLSNCPRKDKKRTGARCRKSATAPLFSMGYSSSVKINSLSENSLSVMACSLFTAAAASWRIEYTVADVEKCKNELLHKAIEDSIQKAQVLTTAANVKLGEIQAIDYSWGEIDFVTKPLNEMRLMECTECEMSAPGAYDIDIEADDINVTDTATVIWEIA